ncbi:MAG: CsgG/HfaB family protein [Bacteroidota bacterium]
MIRRCVPIALLLPLLLSACATTGGLESSTADYRQTIRKLQERLVTNPQDAEAIRDLGVIYFETKQYPQAREYLKKASLANDRDGKTMFYLGMTQEYDKDLRGALATYLNYTDIAESSPYRKLMEGRYQVVTRELIAQQFRELAADETALTNQATPSNAVAVFPLVYEAGDQKFSALGLGLAEMMTIDLGRVKRIRLVERMRVDELLNELKFSASSAVDPATAPRLGKFLSAGRIVGGRYAIGGDNTLRLDVASLDITKAKAPEPSTESDALENLFKIQKEVVFKLVKDMGITLTREEREQIQRIPTKNLQAFLAYSIGLEKEGRGDFEAASVFFRQAGSMDPSFEPAKARAQVSEAMTTSGPTKETALAAAYKVSPPPTPDDGMRDRRRGPRQLLGERLTKLQRLIMMGFVLGLDSRKPAEDATNAGALIDILPTPPRPPQ